MKQSEILPDKYNAEYIRIYSVGVWNCAIAHKSRANILLEFTPLEFETPNKPKTEPKEPELEFTPLEFETQ